MIFIGTTIPESEISTEKPYSYVRGLLIWVNMLVAMSFMFGCVWYPEGKPLFHFQKIDDRANTFRLEAIEPFGFFQSRERVKVIRVFELDKDAYDDEVSQLRWEVRPSFHVFAEGLEVVVGQVPERFIQIFPLQSEMFKPIPGRRYAIAVTLAHHTTMPWTTTSWIAE